MRRSKRELERAVGRIRDGDDDPGPVIAFERSDGTIVDADGEEITEFGDGGTMILLPDDVHGEWEGEYGPNLEEDDK